MNHIKALKNEVISAFHDIFITYWHLNNLQIVNYYRNEGRMHAKANKNIDFILSLSGD